MENDQPSPFQNQNGEYEPDKNETERRSDQNIEHDHEADQDEESAPQIQVEMNDEDQEELDDQIAFDEEIELKKKIALYYHSMFQGCLAQWFVLMQQDNYSKLNQKQYLDLNVRIQKSLILDFDLASAQESAIEDWKIDIEREQIEKQNNNGDGQLQQPNFDRGKKAQQQTAIEESEGTERQQLEGIKELDDETHEVEKNGETRSQQDLNEQINGSGEIQYERLSEFFFDLCLSWCQHLDIETYVFFLNGIFLNITQGHHINVSTFKNIEDITVLSVEFFNKLLEYRNNCDKELESGQTYADWYAKNFGRSHAVAGSVQNNLENCYENTGETRILDIFMDIPKEQENSYLNQHFEKLDKDIANITKASKTADILTNSINFMQTLRQIEANQKALKKKQNQKPAGSNVTSNGQEHTSYLPPYLLLNKNAIGQAGTTHNYTTQIRKDAHNERAQRQDEIERRLVGQLGDRFKDAQLLEVSEGSYLIKNKIKMPIFGNRIVPRLWDKKADSRGSYLKSSLLFNVSNNIKAYVLDKNMPPQYGYVNNAQQMSNSLPGEGYFIANTDTPTGPQLQPEFQQQPQIPFPNGRTGIESFESESDHQMNLGPPQIPQNMNLDGQFSDPQMLNMGMSPDINNINILPKDSQVPFGVQPSRPVDEQTVNYVYSRYIELLQHDKNASIELVLKEPAVTHKIMEANSQGMGFGERDIEQAVIEKLYQEEETQDIQHMIAKFYNKFDELHEQSINQALALSPNRNQMKKEVKYRIPERWTKKFHKYDIVDINIYNQKSGIEQERGKVNKPEKQEEFDLQQKIAALNLMSQEQLKKIQTVQTRPNQESLSPNSQVTNNQYLNQISQPGDDGPLSNDFLKNQSQNQITQGSDAKPPTIQTFQLNAALNQSSPQTDKKRIVGGNLAGPGMIPDDMDMDGESTDISKAGESPQQQRILKTPCGQAPAYDWSEVAYLFEDGVIPPELMNITDPIDYNYLIVRLKKEFNEKHRSDYLRYMHLDLPYHSRRDELGGVIDENEWNAFTRRLEDVISKIKRKRKRIIKRRKKRGKKLMPRATLFKPTKKENLDKNPLWKEVFIHEDSDQDDTSSGEDEAFNMYKDTLATKGIKTVGRSQKSFMNQTGPASNGKPFKLPAIDAHRQSAKQPKRKSKPAGSLTKKKMSAASKIGSGIESEKITPPEDSFAAKQERERQHLIKSRQEALRSRAEEQRFAQKHAQKLIKTDKFSDVFDKEPHKAGRVFRSGLSPLPNKKEK